MVLIFFTLKLTSALQILALRNPGSAVAKAEVCLTKFLELKTFCIDSLLPKTEEFAYVRVADGF
jgi:hypothetical protein